MNKLNEFMEDLTQREMEVRAKEKQLNILFQLLEIAKIEIHKQITKGDIVIKFKHKDIIKKDFEIKLQEYYIKESDKK